MLERTDKPRIFLALGKLIHVAVNTGMKKRELRDWLVKNTETNDLIALIDVFEDLYTASVKKEP